MNIFPNGLACEDHDHFDGKLVPYVEREAEERISGMDIQQQQQQQEEEEEEEEEKKRNGVVEVEVEVELDFEIWPVEHPMEPPDEDRPVKCPMPESSVINVTKFSHNDEGKREKRLAESLRKRTEEQTNKQGTEHNSSSTVHVERPVRAVRKRHHNLTGGDGPMIVPLSRMPPLPTQNLTIFKMLQQIQKFEP